MDRLTESPLESSKLPVDAEWESPSELPQSESCTQPDADTPRTSTARELGKRAQKWNSRQDIEAFQSFIRVAKTKDEQ